MTPTIGLVGTGIIAKFHVEALRQAGVPLVAIADVDEAAGRALAAVSGAEFVGDHRRLLDDPRVQAVIVATPNHTHYEIARDALDAGKDVLCEKPMTRSPEQSADLVARARLRPDQIFQVGYMKRFNSGFRLLRDLLPQLGEVASVHVRVITERRDAPGESWYRQAGKVGGGILVHSGSHLLDVTRWLFGDPVRVDSRVRFLAEREGWDWLSLTLMDMASGVSLYFSTIGVPIGRLGHTQQGWEETIEVVGTRGRVHLSSPNWQGTLPCVVTLQLDGEDQVRTLYPDPTSQWETEARAFATSVETRRQGHPDVVDGYKVDEIIGSIYESARQQSPVPIRWRIEQPER